MGGTLKRTLLMAIFVVALAVLAGCGEGDETNAPAAKLSATTVASATVNGHSHTVSLPFGDLQSSKTVNYRSSIDSGHYHVIALSPGQLADLYQGYRLQTTSTPALTAPSTQTDRHTHAWVIEGGNLVYESICYNCHGNSKRGSSGMSNQPPLASQRVALVNPSGQPLSTATPATPDPSFDPSSVTPDGASLYAGTCASCHGVLASSTKRGRTAVQITVAIGSISSMKGISLSAAQIQAIADALK